MISAILKRILLFSAITQALVQPLIYLEYQIRKEYIVAELCKERYMTINTCEGRCFLVKKLDTAQKQKNEEKERNIRPIEIKLLFSELEDMFLLPVSNDSECEFSSYYLSFYSYLLVDRIDEPPRA